MRARQPPFSAMLAPPHPLFRGNLVHTDTGSPIPSHIRMYNDLLPIKDDESDGDASTGAHTEDCASIRVIFYHPSIFVFIFVIVVVILHMQHINTRICRVFILFFLHRKTRIVKWRNSYKR